MSIHKTNQDNHGFTLIELLVVISIIGLLSSVVLASLSSARTKARDTRRTADIRQVQTALELYYDSNGSYPTSGDLPLESGAAPIVPAYISKMPTSPSNGQYRYYNAGQNPATYYAIYIPYEIKNACYVCGGSTCSAGIGWWGVNIC